MFGGVWVSADFRVQGQRRWVQLVWFQLRMERLMMLYSFWLIVEVSNGLQRLHLSRLVGGGLPLLDRSRRWQVVGDLERWQFLLSNADIFFGLCQRISVVSSGIQYCFRLLGCRYEVDQSLFDVLLCRKGLEVLCLFELYCSQGSRRVKRIFLSWRQIECRRIGCWGLQ